MLKGQFMQFKQTRKTTAKKRVGISSCILKQKTKGLKFIEVFKHAKSNKKKSKLWNY